MKKSIFIFVVFLLFIGISYSQPIGKVTICTDFDAETLQPRGESTIFAQNSLWIIFETFSGTFDEMTLLKRIIKINDNEEKIYDSEEIAIEPDWEITWEQYRFPKGEFIVKYYNKNGSLLGKSKKFMVF